MIIFNLRRKIYKSQHSEMILQNCSRLRSQELRLHFTGTTGTTINDFSKLLIVGSFLKYFSKTGTMWDVSEAVT